MTVREVLVKARALVEKGWTQGTFARNADGVPVPFYFKDATCWCGDGALLKAANYDPIKRRGLYNRARRAMDAAIGGLFPKFNDDGTKAQVLEAFDKAIKAARK